MTIRRWILRACLGVLSATLVAVSLGFAQSQETVNAIITQRLATLLRTLTPAPVIVVPNAIDWGNWRRVCQAAPRPTPALTIGWAGGKRLDTDLLAMAEAWARLARRFPAVEFVVVGHHAAVLREAVPAARLHLIPWLPITTYPRAYQGIDIGCAPLADTPFNRCKSAIKWQEYSAAGAATVASPTVYGQAIRDGREGLLASTAGEWEAALARLIQEPTWRAQLAGRAAKRVRERYSLATHLAEWPAAWETLYAAFRAGAARTRQAVG